MTQFIEVTVTAKILVASAVSTDERVGRMVCDQAMGLFQTMCKDPSMLFLTIRAETHKKEAPAGEDRGQGGKTKETTTKNEPSV